MNFKKSFPFIVIILFLIALGFFLANYNNSTKKITENNLKSVKVEDASIKYVKIGGVTLKIDLATTPEAQTQGLSGRKSLAEDAGMLFIFPESGKYFFWMKDMNFPIDMIWLGADQKIIYLKKNALPKLFPETYGPDIASKYVLEVSANFCEKNNLKVGDGVEFLP